MSEYLYCQTSASMPGLIHIGAADRDPRCKHVGWASVSPFPEPPVFAWVLKVSDSQAAQAALLEVLRPYRAENMLGFYRCDPMEARGEAIRFVALRRPQAEDTAEAGGQFFDLIGASLMAFAIGQQCLHMYMGGTGPTLALMIAPLYWIVRHCAQQRTRRRQPVP